MSEETRSPSSKKGFKPFFRPTTYNDCHSRAQDAEGSNNGSTRIKIKRPPGAMAATQAAAAAAATAAATTSVTKPTTSTTNIATQRSNAASLQKPSAKRLFFQKSSAPSPQPAQGRASATRVVEATTTGRPSRETESEPVWPDKVLFQGGHIGAEPPTKHSPTPRPHRRQESNCSSSRIQETINAEGDHIFHSFTHRPRVLKQKCQRRSCDNDAALTTSAEIQAFMQATYPSHINSTACRTLLNSILSDPPAAAATSDVNERRSSRMLPWAEKYRPDHVEALLGNRQDTIYLRDWLLQMKVQSPAAIEQMRIENAQRRKKKQRKDLFENIPLDDDADDDFMPTSRRPRIRPKLAPAEKMQSNLLLIVGNHGVGKTAAVYTAAEEAGYKVFEIYPGVKRAGKDLIASVGEMTESHLVTFESGGKDESKKRKRDGAESSSSSGSADFMRQFTQQKKQEPSSPQPSQQQQPKQSLVLLEEVDILYEDDKGFWPAVTELAQKSKRPIVMTCNDLSLVPLEQLFLQAILTLEPAPEKEMLAYLQLVCLNEGYLVHPADLAGLFALIGDDLRQMITTLQLWCLQPESRGVDPPCEEKRIFRREPRLFESFTAISHLCRREALVQLSRLQSSPLKTGVDLVEFYNNYDPPKTDHSQDDNSEDTLSHILGALDTAVLDDLLQEREEHDIDECEPDTADRLMGHKPLWRISVDTRQHSVLHNDLSQRIWVTNYEQLHNKEWLRTTVWDQLLENRLDTAGDCMAASGSLLPLRSVISEGCIMADYMPHIRSMCLCDQGVAGRRRALRSRRQRHYLDLTAEQRQVLVVPIQYKDITALWCGDLNKTYLPRCRSLFN